MTVWRFSFPSSFGGGSPLGKVSLVGSAVSKQRRQRGALGAVVQLLESVVHVAAPPSFRPPILCSDLIAKQKGQCSTLSFKLCGKYIIYQTSPLFFFQHCICLMFYLFPVHAKKGFPGIPEGGRGGGGREDLMTEPTRPRRSPDSSRYCQHAATEISKPGL